MVTGKKQAAYVRGVVHAPHTRKIIKTTQTNHLVAKIGWNHRTPYLFFDMKIKLTPAPASLTSLVHLFLALAQIRILPTPVPFHFGGKVRGYSMYTTKNQRTEVGFVAQAGVTTRRAR